ncbi:hypothetical protein LIER_10152 [Lithospermum erythrorhizon]|uniref:Uncharacterized protein n=1 Tax=Lithospermum erythrorhizon TaxID=34254 RepID=A0AAV3PM87_LITER
MASGTASSAQRPSILGPSPSILDPHPSSPFYARSSPSRRPPHSILDILSLHQFQKGSVNKNFAKRKFCEYISSSLDLDIGIKGHSSKRRMFSDVQIGFDRENNSFVLIYSKLMMESSKKSDELKNNYDDKTRLVLNIDVPVENSTIVEFEVGQSSVDSDQDPPNSNDNYCLSLSKELELTPFMDSSHCVVGENSCFDDDGDDGYWSSSDSLDEDHICSMDNEFAWYDVLESSMNFICDKHQIHTSRILKMI